MISWVGNHNQVLPWMTKFNGDVMPMWGASVFGHPITRDTAVMCAHWKTALLFDGRTYVAAGHP